jgi:hypothetical protein
MPDSWNYDSCVSCRHFSARTTDKGIKLRCTLNNGKESEKRAFAVIWNENYLIERGVMKEKHRSTIIVEYVGLKKRGRKG